LKVLFRQGNSVESNR